jgi:hypothetical protein
MGKVEPSDGSGYEVADVYRRLRDQVLALRTNPAGVTDSPILGLLMETGYDDAVATLVTVVDGTVSFYFSNGGGMIGLGEHEEVRQAAASYLATARQFLPMAQPAAAYPLPTEGNVTFYFITPGGVRSYTADEDDLGNHRLPLSPLFHKAHEVIGRARQADEARQQALEELLHVATTGQKKKLAELLETLSPDVADPSGLTPLMAAAHSGQVGSLHQLLAHQATIDKKDAEGYTALMFACNGGKLPSVQVLVENGANVNAGDKDDSTPLMFAAQHGHNDIVRYLLEKGADPNLVGKHGLSAVGFARQNDLGETERLLTQRR